MSAKRCDNAYTREKATSTGIKNKQKLVPLACRIAAASFVACVSSPWALAMEGGAATKQSGETGSQYHSAEMEEILVTGIRAANRATIEAKKSSNLISDSISVTDIGELPDFNIAEALSRVAGVSTEQSRGEDRYVTVRGMKSALNYVSIDGAVLPGTDPNDRAVPMDILPSSLVTQIDINKSFNAAMDGNAIGSHINMKTRSAFDTADRYLRVEGSLGNYDQDNGPVDTDPSYTTKATFADKFGEFDNWGVVLSASLYNRENYTKLPAVTSGLWDWYSDDPTDTTRYTDPFAPEHNGHPVPTGAKSFLYLNDRERYGGFAKLEFQGDNFYWFMDGLHYRFKDDERRYETLIDRDRNQIVQNQTPTSGLITRASMQAAVIDQLFDFELSAWQTGLDYEINDSQRISLGYNISKGKYNQPFTWDKFNNGKTDDLAYNYTYSNPQDNYPEIAFVNPDFYADASNYRHLYHRERATRSVEDVQELRVDYTWEIDNTDLFVKLGGKYRQMERIRDRKADEWRLIDRDNYTMDQALHTYTFVPEGFGNNAMFLIDPNMANSFFSDNPELFNPSANNAREAVINDFEVEENITAAYVMAGYDVEQLQLAVGLRFEDTDYVTTGTQRLRLDGEAETFPLITRNEQYESLLPSFSLTYWVREDIAVRVAYSETLGRASYDQLRPNQTFTADEDSISISGGNPELKPREAENFDLSLEYYFAEGDGLLSLGAFHKNIENEIFTARTQTEELVDDLLVVTTITRPENAESAKIRGLEMNFILGQFDFLPAPWNGFGINLNYAHIKSDSTVLMNNGETRDLYGLLNQPENIVNASLKYSYGDFEGRIAYKYRDERLTSISTSASGYWKDRFHDERETVDLQLRYNITDNLHVKLDLKNLTESSQVSEINEDLQYRLWERDYGRSAWLGVSWRAF